MPVKMNTNYFREKSERERQVVVADVQAGMRRTVQEIVDNLFDRLPAPTDYDPHFRALADFLTALMEKNEELESRISDLADQVDELKKPRSASIDVLRGADGRIASLTVKG